MGVWRCQVCCGIVLLGLFFGPARVQGQGPRPDVGGPVTDATLKALRESCLLHTLCGARGKCNSRPLAPEQVIALNLHATCVTDVGLKELIPLRNLTRLYLPEARVTDATLRSLREIGLLPALSLTVLKGNLRSNFPGDVVGLNLFGTQVTDVGLKELADFKNLATLNLTNTQVTDAGLKELADFKNLRALYLNGTRVTDAGLKELANCKSLTTLHLVGTQTTVPGVMELSKAIPLCKIRR